MHIVMDAREAFSQAKSGKGQWAAGLIGELSKRDLRLTLLGDTRSSSSGIVRLPGGIRWHGAALRYLRGAEDADCYVSPTSFIVPALLPASVKRMVVVHDLIAFQGEPHDRKATMIERLFLGRALKKASCICTISESTKHDLLEKFPEISADSVRVVYAGPALDPPAPRNPDGKTILCVATLCPRKNQLRLIRAYAALPSPLREKYRLVLAGGRGWQDTEILRMARNTKGVEWTGYVSDAEYQRLLTECDVFALPSLYEGFGMQILDALQRGIPVLTSQRGSLKEVAGTSAVFVDPESERSIGSGLASLLESEDLRNSLRVAGPVQAKQFSWKRTADLFLAAAASVVY